MIKKILERFMKKESKDKSNRLYNCKNRKEKKEYVKWKGFDNSYNSWIDKKKCCYIKWVIFQNHVNVVKAKYMLNYLPNYATKSDLKRVTKINASTKSA